MFCCVVWFSCLVCTCVAHAIWQFAKGLYCIVLVVSPAHECDGSQMCSEWSCALLCLCFGSSSAASLCLHALSASNCVLACSQWHCVDVDMLRWHCEWCKHLWLPLSRMYFESDVLPYWEFWQLDVLPYFRSTPLLPYTDNALSKATSTSNCGTSISYFLRQVTVMHKMTLTHRFRNLFTQQLPVSHSLKCLASHTVKTREHMPGATGDPNQVTWKLLGRVRTAALGIPHWEWLIIMLFPDFGISNRLQWESPPTALTLATSITKINSERKRSTCSHHVMSPMYCVWESQIQNVWSYTTTGRLVSVLAVPGTVMLLWDTVHWQAVECLPASSDMLLWEWGHWQAL